MKRKRSKAFGVLALAFMMVFSFAIAGCGPDTSGDIVKYAVVFDYNDGSSRPYTVNVIEGKSVSAPADPIRIGYDFGGWWTEKTGGIAAVLPVTPTMGVTYYAHWSMAVYKVNFDLNYDNKPVFSSQEVTYGESAVLPEENPSRPGYGFIGWFTASAGGVQVSAATAITSNTTYYAHWSVNRYTITYNYNYTGAPQSGYATYDYNTEAEAPSQPIRTGHSFDGWWTESVGGNLISFPYMVTGNIPMYARWTADKCTVTFDYNYNSADADYASQPTAVERPVDFGSTVTTLDMVARDNHMFAGWYTQRTGGEIVNFNAPVTGDATYYAQWREKDAVIYTLVFNENYTGGKTQSIEVVQGQSTSGIQNPSRTGYTFDGWWTESSGGSRISMPYTPTADNITLYAHWKVVEYTVTFNYNYTGAPSPSNEKIDYGNSVTEPSMPIRSGYNFAGWYTAAEGGAKIEFPYEVSTNLTFFAQWNASVFTVTYNGNSGGDSVTNMPSPGTSVGGFIQREPGKPRRSGWQFAGWYTAAEGGTQVSFPYTTTESSITLYAHWTRIQYSFRFYSTIPGASGYTDGGIVDYGGTFTAAMLPVAPVRPGFRFIGWYTAERSDDGSLVSFPYTPVFPSDTESRNILIYAHWTAEQVVTDTFQAEYTLFDVKDTYYGLSGQVNGIAAIVQDTVAERAGSSVDSNLPRTELGISDNTGYFVASLSTAEAQLDFEIYSTRAMSNVTLRVALMSDLKIDAGVPNYSFGSTGDNAYRFIVNGSNNLSYSDITLTTGELFKEYQISTTVSLNEGKNVISLITANTNAIQGGTTTAIGPRVDYLKLSYGGAQNALSYYPIYDNVRAWT